MAERNSRMPADLMFNTTRELIGISDAPSVVRELVHPGKDTLSLLMRTAWPDDRTARLAAVLLLKSSMFDIPEYEELVKAVAAALTSVEGHSRRDLVQVATGVAVPAWGLQSEGRRRKGVLSRMFGGGER